MPKVISYTVRKSVFSIKRLQAYWIGLLLVLTSCVTTWGQPILNERVDLQPTNYTAISNVEVANDSTYIFAGDGYDSTINKNYIIIFATDINFTIKWRHKIIDSTGNSTPSPLDDSYFTSEMKSLSKSLDGSLLYSFNKHGSDTLNLIRFNSLGNVLDSGVYRLIHPTDTTVLYGGYEALEFKEDSSIYIPTLNHSSSPSSGSAVKLTKELDLLQIYHFPEPGSSTNNVSLNSLSRCPPKLYKDSLIILSGFREYNEFIPNTVGSPKNKFRAFVRLCKKDGTTIHEWIDTNYMSTQPMGIVPLKNGNIIVVNTYGKYFKDPNSIRSGMKVFCLDSTLNQLWEHRIDTVDLFPMSVKESKNMIWTKDSSLVIVGRDHKWDTSAQYQPPDDWPELNLGRITKINRQGEVLWDRYHYNMTFPEQPYGGRQELLDIAQTQDSGFIAVGKVSLFNDCQAGIIPCQFGWVLKTDQYGCIVPGCHLEPEDPDGPDEPEDTTTQEKDPILLLHPNPAQDVVHIYFRSEQFTDQGTVKIIDLKGNIVHSFTLFKNDMTYTLPVHDLAQGTYIVQYSTPNHTFQTDKLVIVR